MPQQIRKAALLTAAALLFAVYFPLSPWLPADGLDPSWILGISYALNKGLRFGSDLTFTYGPLGGLFCRAAWGGGMLGITLLWLALLAGASVAVHLCLRERSAAHVALALVPLVLIFSLDAFALYLLFAVACSADAVARDMRLVVAFSLLSALLALCKFTFAAASFIALAPVACYRLAGSSPRDFKAHLSWILFPVAWLACWVLLAGQRVSDFGEYVRRSYIIARAYSVAMALHGPTEEVWLGAGVLSAIVLAAGLLAPSLPRRPLRLAEVAPLVRALSLVALAWLGFKQGFVRHDGHALVYMSFAGAALATVWLTLPSTIPAWSTRLLRTGAALWVLLAVKGSQHHMGGRGLLEQFEGHIEGRLSELRSTLLGDNDWPARFRAALDDIKKANPLPPVGGRVDVASVGIARALANGLDWGPRPIFQSYSAYTPALARANEAYVADSVNGPKHYFVSLTPIDGRAALQEDPLLWPQLLAHFDAISIGSDLHFQRRVSPRKKSTRGISIKRGDGYWRLPTNLGNGYVALKASPERGPVQRLASILLRPPAIYLKMLFGDGREHSVRYVDSLESTPFIISPFVRTNLDFMLLSANASALEHLRVAAFRFVDESGEEVPVRATPRATLVTLSNDAKQLERPRDPRVPILPDVVTGPYDVYANPVLSDGDRHVINAHSPTMLSFEATANGYKVCFGIRDGAAWEKPEFDGVRYTIRVDASQEALLDRLLTSKGANPTEHEECRVVVKPSGAKTLLLETLPNGTPSYDWAYWTIEPV